MRIWLRTRLHSCYSIERAFLSPGHGDQANSVCLVDRKSPNNSGAIKVLFQRKGLPSWTRERKVFLEILADRYFSGKQLNTEEGRIWGAWGGLCSWSRSPVEERTNSLLLNVREDLQEHWESGFQSWRGGLQKNNSRFRKPSQWCRHAWETFWEFQDRPVD